MVALSPAKGRLLIAQPTILNDTSFNRTIIYITEHTQNSSVGFIMNKPTKYVLSDLIPEIDCDFTVYNGGPVEQDNLYFIHTAPHKLPNSIEVSDGIYWGGNFNLLQQLLNEHKVNPNEIRFFLGYSGWDKDQLENELNTDSWFVSENDYDNIFSKENESLWKNKLLQRGGRFKIWANAPSNIQLN